MTTSLPPGDPRALWQSQAAETISFSMSLEELRAQSKKFHDKIRFRNLRELVAAAVVVVVFSGYALFLPGLVFKIGCVMIVSGTLYMTAYLQRNGQTNAMPPDASARAGLDFYRDELVRQRDLLNRIWRWYLGPLLPGLAVSLAGLMLNSTHSLRSTLGTAAFCGAVFGFAAIRNAHAAKDLSEKIATLSTASIDSTS